MYASKALIEFDISYLSLNNDLNSFQKEYYNLDLTIIDTLTLSNWITTGPNRNIWLSTIND